MRSLILAVTIALAALPLTLHAQGDRETGERRHAIAVFGAADPAARALAASEALELTAEQIAALEAIQMRLHATNEPLLAQLRETLPEGAGEMRGQRRQGMGERRGGPRGRMTARREHMAAARPVMQQIRENRREAASEVAAVLTPEQQAQLDAERAEARREMRARQEMRERRREWR